MNNGKQFYHFNCLTDTINHLLLYFMKTKTAYFFVCCLYLCSTLTVSAERVGLVLSGGGAKGMTHVGVIKALEEHNIPIDYVAGTSMGAIVAGMYAIGMSTDEMIELLKSDDFKRWSTGEMAQSDIYYYKSEDPSPTIIDLRLRINRGHGLDSLSIRPIFPSNVLSPVQMNFAFLQLFLQANAVAGSNFDNLFVPFRCVAADIYRKEAVVFSGGNLGDAIRASMSIPFVFRPIEIDGRLLFDGGIYNNFPVDVMINDFNPDFIIGSYVALDPPQPTLDNPATQLLSLVMNPVHTPIPENGVLFHFDLRNQPELDFSPVDRLVELGYTEVVARIDEIRHQVNRQVTPEEVTARRAEFRSMFPPLIFNEIRMTGINESQQAYVSRIFRHTTGGTFDLNTLRRGYFQLVSDDRIHEVIPHAQFNPETGYFDLYLHVEPETNLRLRLGGNISSSTSNQAYIGIQNQVIGNFSRTTSLDTQFGKTYNGIQLGVRIDFPTRHDWYARSRLVAHRFDYYTGGRFLLQNNSTHEFSQAESFLQTRIGRPFTQKGRMEFGIGVGLLTDKYFQDSSMRTGNVTPDRSRYFITGLFYQLETHTLNKVMYPTRGAYTILSLKAVYGRESFESGASVDNDINREPALWLQLNGKYKHYFPISSRFTLGAYGTFAFSTRPFSQNYLATIIQAPRFDPTPFSKTVFNEAFVANRYVAVGAKPIFKLSNTLSLRNETYMFVPYRSFVRQPDGTAAYSQPFQTAHFMSELSFIFDIFRGTSIAIFANYTSAGDNRWNFGINIGTLLFNERILK